MATPMKQTLENRNAKRTSVSVSGPAYMVVVGGAPRGSKPKTRKYTITISEKPITSRYLRPRVASCHDFCKHATNDDVPNLKKPTRFRPRKPRVIKNQRVRRTPVVLERKKVMKTKHKPKRSSNPKPYSCNEAIELKKIGVSRNKKLNKNNLKLTKKDEKDKANHTGSLPKMTTEKLKQLITEKVTEMTINEATTTKLESLPLTVEIIESPPTVTPEETDLSSSESSQSCLDEQVSEQHEDANHEEIILSEVDYEMVTSEGNSNCRVVICEDKENGGLKVKFRRGKVLEDSDDEGPWKVKFRRGTILEGDEEDDPEKVTLKHQEQERKEAQELLNRVIEETASKLVEDRKTKVGALVGAFETVLSLQDKPVSANS